MTTKLIVQCGECKRTRVDWLTWVDKPVPEGKVVTHSVCPKCHVKLYPEVAAVIIARYYHLIGDHSAKTEEG